MVLQHFRQPRYLIYLLVLIIGIIGVISYADLSRSADLKATGDATSYIEMSKHTFSPVPNPFALRALSPFIVHQLSKLPILGLNSAWLLLTYCATSLAIIVFFKLLYDHFKLTLYTSALFTILLALTYSYASFNYWDYWLVDPLNNLCYILAIYCLLQRRLWWFVVVIALGSINKETTLLLAPLYPLLSWLRAKTIQQREVIVSTLAVMGTGVMYVVYHLWAQWRIGGPHGYLALSGVNGQSVWENIRFSVNIRKTEEHLAIFRVFQFLWVTFAYGLYRAYKEDAHREVLIVSLWLLGAVLFGRLFATDTERVYVMAAPMVLGVSALLFDNFRTEAQRLWLGVMAFLYVALNLRWLGSDFALAANVGALVIFIGAIGRGQSLASLRLQKVRAE